MPKQLVSILHPEDVWAGAQAKPFTLCDTLTIADAGMVYSDRHPRPVIWFGEGALNPRKPVDVNEIEQLIGKGVTDGKGPGTLEAWEKSWAVYCALTDGVQKGSVPATKPVYLPTRRINPVLTEIPLSALLDLARQRGDAGEIVSSLLTWYEDNPPEPAAAELPLSTVPAVTTAETAAVERRTRSQRSRGPKPGTTGFGAADHALFLEIKRLRKTGEARSTIAATHILATAGRIAGKGTTESLAVRLARRYGRSKSTSTPKD